MQMLFDFFFGGGGGRSLIFPYLFYALFHIPVHCTSVCKFFKLYSLI